MNRLSEQRLLEENRALHSQVARLTYELQSLGVDSSSCVAVLGVGNSRVVQSMPPFSAELEMKEAEARQLRVQVAGDPAARADLAGNVLGSGRLVQLEAELKMARVRTDSYSAPCAPAPFTP